MTISVRPHIATFAALFVLTAAAFACSEATKPSGTDVFAYPTSDASDSAVAEDVTGEDDADVGGVVEPEPCESDGMWGCACKSNDECLAGYCVEAEQGLVCSRKCIETCPKDWKCVQAGDTSDLAYVCVPKYTTLCRPCSDHGDCGQVGVDKGTNKCIEHIGAKGFVDGSFCGIACDIEEAGDCPSGFNCLTVSLPGEATVGQCFPESGECTCSASEVAQKLSTSCERSNEFGTCAGTRTCTVDGLTLCNVQAPEVEVCDGEDNDCDGLTDENDAVGCKVWYPDNDGDGFGIGEGGCQCANPGLGYAPIGGDCNDIVMAINPTGAELCDDLDNNCNGETDEAGSAGCSVFYKDKDGDKFGDPDDSACMCPSKKTADWITEAGDCDDTVFEIKPGVPEVCNGHDDDCDGKTDDENAQGCTLWYIDGDFDGYGPTELGKCLCAADLLYSVDKPGDCDDTKTDVHPTQIEVCDGVDEDCNGITDDGAAVKSCPALPNGGAACQGGKCVAGNCAPGYFDVDGNYDNGCECAADGWYGKSGGTCEQAQDLGAFGEAGSKDIKSGNVMPGEDGDWFRFDAVDTPDNPGAAGACDNFHVRVRFLINPGDQFVIDLYRGSCAGAAQICKGEVDTGWTVKFYGPPFGPATAAANPKGKDLPSPEPPPAGECKCAGGEGLPGMNTCSDNSAPFFVRVSRKAGLVPTCDFYQLEITNGVYSP